MSTLNTSMDQAKIIAARRITRLHDQVLFKEHLIEMIHQCKKTDKRFGKMIAEFQDEIKQLKALINDTHL